MPPRRPARPTPPDVDTLRAAVDRGQIVRVGIAPSGQFPDGVTGRVRRIGDPAVDGDEFIFVEVPLGGAKDVLPFAATDLIASPRRPSSAQTKVPAPGAAAVDAPGAARPDALFPDPPPGAPRPGAQPPSAQPPGPPPSATAGPLARTARSAGTASRARRGAVTITISTSGDESAVWRIEAKIGAKAAVRPTVIPPSRVWDIVFSLGDPKLSSLVKSLLDDHRRSTQSRADALAAELAALQDELKSFPDNADTG